MPYIVELEKGCWLAPWIGDPGRTSVIHSAKVFADEAAGKGALTRVRKMPGRNGFPNARVVPVHVETHIVPINR